MRLIAEFAHPRDPEAIAETIRQELQPLDIDSLVVEVAIVDSSLDLQIRTNSAVDKEKLLTLLHGELQNLRIESVAKFRIHCWRNDDEIHEQHLLWTEQFMIDSPTTNWQQSRCEQTNNLNQAISLDNRLPESQLSKSSVLQEAINKIAPTHPKATPHPVATEKAETENKAVENSPSSLLSQGKIIAPVSVSTNSYWQLLLLAASIILLGLGIGASVRALTMKAGNQAQIRPIPNLPNPVNKQVATRSETSSNISPGSPEKSIDISTNLKSTQADTAGKITLEKFNIVKQGMTVEEVEKIFGIAGKVIAENNDGKTVGMVYSWKNPEGSNAIIEFKDGQVVAKAQAGL